MTKIHYEIVFSEPNQSDTEGWSEIACSIEYPDKTTKYSDQVTCKKCLAAIDKKEIKCQKIEYQIIVPPDETVRVDGLIIGARKEIFKKSYEIYIIQEGTIDQPLLPKAQVLIGGERVSKHNKCWHNKSFCEFWDSFVGFYRKLHKIPLD